MADQKCPNCGGDLPAELGQHAVVPTAGIVECPHCGEKVTLERPGTAASGGGGDDDGGHDVVGESTGEESFSGHETMAGVMDEIEQKEDA